LDAAADFYAGIAPTSLSLRRAGRLVPPSIGGHLQRLPQRLTFGVTGPFNGQRHRTASVRAIFEAVPFKAVIETGTFRGLTTRFLSDLTTAPVATIELSQSYFDYSRGRLARRSNVHQFLGQSPSVLARLADDPAWTVSPAFFYLDAHWHEYLPLVDELNIIVRAWPDFVAMVDDFKVDGDAGYIYDDYGPGKSLELDLIKRPEFRMLHVFWPAAPASAEKRMRQGSVTLATQGPMSDALRHVKELRYGGPLVAGDLE
jgi:hypothetical protein